MALPTRYRTDLIERCEGRVVLTVHDDRCLLLYPQPEWDEIERKLVRLPILGPYLMRAVGDRTLLKSVRKGFHAPDNLPEYMD